MRNANHTCLRKKEQSWTSLQNGRCCDPSPPSVTLLCDKKVLKKSQTYIGDGINDRRCFLYMYTNPGRCLECNFLVMFTYLILSSVLGCRAVIQLIIDQHIKRFFFLKGRYLWSKWRVYQSFKNKALTGNTSFFFVNILSFSVFF